MNEQPTSDPKIICGKYEVGTTNISVGIESPPYLRIILLLGPGIKLSRTVERDNVSIFSVVEEAEDMIDEYLEGKRAELENLPLEAKRLEKHINDIESTLVRKEVAIDD